MPLRNLKRNFLASNLPEGKYIKPLVGQPCFEENSTIDGYRTAIVDTLGPTGLHISQSSDLNRLLSSFHRDRPKSSRNLPKWNLSVVLNELTKAPFEPTKRHRPQISYSQNCFLASFGLRQRNPCLGCKQSI